MLIRDGQDLCLHRRKPAGESTGIVLNQDADKALNGAVNHAVQHDRTMLLAVLPHIGEIELLRHQHIKLNRAALPGTANGIFQMEIYFRAVESAVSFIHHIFQAAMLQGILQRRRGLLPDLIGAHGILRARGELRLVGQAEGGIHLIEQVNGVLYFLLNHRRRDKEMGIILGEVADAEQAVQGTGKLMAVYQAKLTETQGQVAVAVGMGLVDQHTPRAVHGLHCVIFIIYFREVHIFLVMIPVARSLPQLTVHNHRRFDFLVAVAAMHLTPVIDEFIANNHAVGVEEGEARPLLMQGEKIQFLAQLAVVALLSLLQHMQVGVQFLLLLESRAIDALQHLVIGIATPVRAGHALQLDGLDLARGNNMGPGAQIRKLALAIHGNGGIFRQVIDKLHLVALALFLEEFQGFGAAHFLAGKCQVLLDYLLHFLLDIPQISIRQLTLHIEIIVKPVFNGRADCQLHLAVLVQALHCLGQDVGSRMAQCPAAICILEGQKLDLGIFIQHTHKIPRLPIHLGGQHLLGQAITHLLDKIQYARALGNLSHRAILQRNFKHFQSSSQSKNPVPQNEGRGHARGSTLLAPVMDRDHFCLGNGEDSGEAYSSLFSPQLGSGGTSSVPRGSQPRPPSLEKLKASVVSSASLFFS